MPPTRVEVAPVGDPARSRSGRAGLGRLCLDFVATAATPPLHDGEQLWAPADVAAWFLAAELPASRLAATPGDLVRTVTLRDAIAVVLERALDDGGPVRPDDLARALDVVNDTAAIAPPRPRLDHDDAAAGFAVTWESPSDLAPFLSALSRDALDLVADDQARARLHRCAAADCRRIFMAKPIGRARRWCSSQGCGARMRVAAYRARHARPQETPSPRLPS